MRCPLSAASLTASAQSRQGCPSQAFFRKGSISPSNCPRIGAANFLGLSVELPDRSALAFDHTQRIKWG